MNQRRVQQPGLFDTVPPKIDFSALQAEERALLEVLLAEAIGETHTISATKRKEASHDENNS